VYPCQKSFHEVMKFFMKFHNLISWKFSNFMISWHIFFRNSDFFSSEMSVKCSWNFMKLGFDRDVSVCRVFTRFSSLECDKGIT
jgi:hypothetical protein